MPEGDGVADADVDALDVADSLTLAVAEAEAEGLGVDVADGERVLLAEGVPVRVEAAGRSSV